ncbi:MAG: ATP-binding protein [Thermoleophilaceae bacterium]
MSSTIDVAQACALPPDEVGTALAAITEDQWFDRTSVRVKERELANVEIGFGNADGGVIVVGIHDGQVEGTDSLKKHRNALMQAHIDFAAPPVRVHSKLVPCVRSKDGADDNLLLLEIQPGEGVHANVNDEVYLRIGDETRRLTYTQRRELLYDRGHGIFEGRTVKGDPSDLLNQGLLQAYADALGHPHPMRLLKARGLIQGSKLTIAGLLLFGEHPQSELPEAFIRVLRYRGSQRGTGARQQLEQDIRLEGPIPYQLIEAQKLVMDLQPRRRALTDDGRFETFSLVPEDAWLEGIVNAAVHRSYSLAGDHIRVEIFDDRVETESPGRFPGLVDPSDPMNAPRFARNPRIARVCADQRFGQELGEGIRRMFEEMRLAGLEDPFYEETPASVRLTLSGEAYDRDLDARLPRDSRAIMAALREGGALSTGEIAGHIGISRVTARTRLDQLRTAGMVEWTGKSARDPRASWSLSRT